MLGVTDLGLGAVWCGLHPKKDAVEKVRTILNLDEKYIPLLAVLAAGIFAIQSFNLPVPFGSSGHLLGAAGAIEFVTCVKEIEEGFIHRTVGLQESDEEMDLDYCKTSCKKDITYALSNSLGFGGHNTSILVKKYVK